MPRTASAAKKVSKKRVKSTSKRATKSLIAKRTLKKKIRKPELAPITNVKKPTSTKTTGNYLSKSELMKAVMESRSLGRMSDDLAMKLKLLTEKYAKAAQWARYPYNEDMRGYALASLVKTWKSFNPQKSNNPFAFFTQCIKNSFIQFLNYEKRHRLAKDTLLIKNGLSPSYTYQLEYEEGQAYEREQRMIEQESNDTEDVSEEY